MIYVLYAVELRIQDYSKVSGVCFGLNNPLNTIHWSQVHCSCAVSDVSLVSLVNEVDKLIFGGGKDKGICSSLFVCFSI